VWEKIQEKLVALGRESAGVKKALGSWVKGLALDSWRRRGRSAGPREDRAPPCYGCATAVQTP